MKYLVKTREIEIWEKSYLVEASSKKEAEDKWYLWKDVEDLDDQYCETDGVEIIKIEPYEN